MIGVTDMRDIKHVCFYLHRKCVDQFLMRNNFGYIFTLVVFVLNCRIYIVQRLVQCGTQFQTYIFYFLIDVYKNDKPLVAA